MHLHLFLHARGLLSAAIRMNALGPYAAQQLLLHSVRPLVDTQLARTAHISTGILDDDDDDGDDDEKAFERSTHMPTSTWPLGEITAARHDQLHSRMFNS